MWTDMLSGTLYLTFPCLCGCEWESEELEAAVMREGDDGAVHSDSIYTPELLMMIVKAKKQTQTESQMHMHVHAK